MKEILKNRIAMIFVDIALIGCFIGSLITSTTFEESKHAIMNGEAIEDVFAWGTSHCIVSLVFVCLMIIHIWQKWLFYKALITKKLFNKNKLITAMSVLFILTIISILLYIIGFSFTTLHIHSLIVHIFVVIVIIHILTKIKRLVGLIRYK